MAVHFANRQFKGSKIVRFDRRTVRFVNMYLYLVNRLYIMYIKIVIRTYLLQTHQMVADVNHTSGPEVVEIGHFQLL